MATNDEILIKLKALDELTPVMLRALQTMEATTSKMSDALEQVGKSSQSTTQHTEGLHGGVITLAAGFHLLKEAAHLAYEAFEKVERFLEKAIEESVEAEKAFNRLQGALISNGKYTKEAAHELHEYAEATEHATGASAEHIQNTIAAGIQMGLSTERAMELEEATRKLAAATGGSLESALHTLQGSLAGQTRGLARVLPQVKELGSAQLKMGDQLAIVNKALEAQYQLYQGSFAAGLDRAKTGVGEVYKEIGNLITQNPVVQAAVKGFGDILVKLADGIKEVNHWFKENKQTVSEVGTALKYVAIVALAAGAAFLLFTTVIPFCALAFSALSISVGLYGVAGTIAANATDALDAGLAILFAPITLIIGAVAALTFAFYKWPGLFDILIGGIKGLIGLALTPLTGAFGALSMGIGAIVGVFRKDWGNALTNAGEQMMGFSSGLIKAGGDQIMLGVESIKTGKKVKEGAEEGADALEKQKQAQSDAYQVAIKFYDSFAIGTFKQREALQGQVQERTKDLSDFTAYLDAKKRMAITKAAEQEMEVNKIIAGNLKGGGGGEDKSAEAQVAIDAETRKQAELKFLRDKGVIDVDQYNEALLASTQRAQQAELQGDQAFAQARAEALGDGPASFALRMQIKTEQFDKELALAKTKAAAAGNTSEQIKQMEVDRENDFFQKRLALAGANNALEIQEATAHTQALADALGTSEAAFQMKQGIEDTRYQLELSQRMQRATEEGATEDQINQLKESAYTDHLQRMKEMKLKHLEDDLKKNQTLGNNWQATLDIMRIAQEKDGKVLGTIRGIQQTDQFKGTMKGLSDLSSLRSSHNKTAFEVGKKAAIAQATVNTFLSATEAFASLASIPLIGPVLGAAAAAAAIASGFVQIQGIQGQQFSQAHGGLDEVPSNMSNKTFLLSAGERVVQPEANKDLTAFLDSAKGGGSAGGKGGAVYNITLNYQGGGNPEDSRKMAEMVVKEIRDMSERGTPIMSDKGIVRSDL